MSKYRPTPGPHSAPHPAPDPKPVLAPAPAPAPTVRDASGLNPPRCQDCRYFWMPPPPDAPPGQTPPDPGTGECRRYPPAALVKEPTPQGPLTAFPLVVYDSFCGEFSRRIFGPP